MRRITMFGRKKIVEEEKEKTIVQEKNERETIENLKSTIRKTAGSVYHENIISSFTHNLDQVVGRRVKEVEKSAIESSDSMIKVSGMIEELSGKVKDLNRIASDNLDSMLQSNQKVKDDLKQAGTSLEALDKDITETINETTAVLSEFPKISRMAEAILSIAHQTSILSLNASIEAARAGEAGKGFAVVASEIQKLSSETDRTSKDISSLVEELSKKVGLSMQNIQKMNIFKVLKESLDEIMNVLAENEEFLVKLSESSKDMNVTMENGLSELESSKGKVSDLLSIVTTVRDVVDVVLKTQLMMRDVQI